jgi:isoleucyl-tRNA synthetase
MTTPPQSPPAPASGKPSAESDKSPYRATLNLPKTSFLMKANLVQNEPASLKRWNAMGLYEKSLQVRAGAPRFVFHDGPPYANGSIHLGHLLNKCLKDFVVRTSMMSGHTCHFVPGWDCHGLPIEHKVMTELMEAGKLDKLKGLPAEQRHMAVRRECRKYAEKFVKLQAMQLQRLLTLADYDHPYLTMAPEFEGATLEVLARLMEQGLVYRALKPVHWSVANETALAEAELEYYDREDISVYVDFEAADADAVYDAFGLPREDALHADRDDMIEAELAGDAPLGSDLAVEASGEEDWGPRPTQRPSFMIWTTTPWTLPANLAIAVNPKIVYALVRVDGNIAVMAADAVERVTKAAKSEEVKVLATTTGAKLVGLSYRHPFVSEGTGVERTKSVWTVLPAEYVTLEDGTGLVHTAPGHGADDFATGKANGIPIYCPVLGDGRYDQSVPEFLRGLSIWKANDLIVQNLRDSGHLFHDHKFTHSYPHDWRGKTPVIFRCTEQWFIGVDTPTRREERSMRELGLSAVDAQREDRVRFVPEWGRNRMRGMLDSRPDWCISRQRAWGLPIPAFFTPEGSVFMTPASVRAVAKMVREKGSDVWFTAAPAELLAHYNPASDADAKQFLGSSPERFVSSLTKGPDILDVWFESGSTWNAVIRERFGDADFPTDLYLEGSDQHRGWFQSSMLTSLGATGKPRTAHFSLTASWWTRMDTRCPSRWATPSRSRTCSRISGPMCAAGGWPRSPTRTTSRWTSRSSTSRASRIARCGTRCDSCSATWTISTRT